MTGPARVPLSAPLPASAGGAVSGGRVARPAALGGVAFRLLLAVYTAIAVAKVQDLLPVLGRLQPAKVTGALLIAGALVLLPAAAWRGALRTPPVRWAAVIGVLAVLSVPFSQWPGLSFQVVTRELWKTLAFFLIAASAFADRQTVRLAIVGLVLSAALVALRVVLGAEGAALGRHYVGSAFDPNELALLFLVVIPFALHRALRRGWSRVCWSGAALLLVAGIVKTGSRGGFLGLLVLAVWLVYQARPRRRLTYVVALVAGAAVFQFTASEATWERFSSIFSPRQDYNYSAREGRFKVWKRGVGYMVTHPLLGVGIGAFPVADGVLSGKENEGEGIKYSAAHNSFLEIGAELGVLGLVAFVGMLWTAAAGCWRVRAYGLRAPPGAEGVDGELRLADATLSALVAFAVGGFFLSFAYHPLTFFVVAMCVGVRVGSPLLASGGGLPLVIAGPPERSIRRAAR